MQDDDRRLNPGTRLVTAGRPELVAGRGIVNPPVWRASTILYESVAELRAGTRKPDDGLYYGRRGTPTQWSLADALTELEPGAEGTLLFPSGVAAVTSVLLSLLSPGDELLMVDSAYEPTRAVCNGMLKRFGVTTRYYDPLIGAGIAELIGDKTRVIFLESPGSLTFEVQDVPAIAAVAREHGIATVIDNTWATPLLFPALGHGVDISILACTKYIVGHSDVMMGSATAGPAHYPALRRTAMSLGQCVSPDDAYLAARGLRTLGVRMRQHEEGGLAVARWLAEQPQVARVLHPALPDCPGHEYWRRDFAGASGLFGIVLDGGDDAARAALIDGLDLFGIGFSWGGYESLALPVDPAGLRSATTWQADGPVVRFHIGIEDPADLIADLERGLARFESARHRRS
ncbi:cystathionine beta-lyase [Rhizorhabdus dicambivorans]|uniref:Cystathionine beta-lyase n=1 Tax=Rhizorhabdus dicambivorans TaxID=1850238 RepID=A0A2A4G171_9SPHN|nr:cystathionine beta-lyase [Rhizorhabdus dicambivorans]ATE66771.1 cystathionine beta-lyase [Rhizorhabdus dicambivorans]PCE43741.1 cystathionine beta-lyase [Rhizorhabdus dicambivorans]